MKKSDSLNSLQESEDLDLDLKGRIIEKGNLYPKKFRSETGLIHGIKGIMSTISSFGTQRLLEQSGQTKLINTAAKSIGKDSVMENSSKATSGKSPSQIYPTMTFSAVASLVKVFPLREGVKVFKTSQGELFSLKSAESLEVKDQATYSLRMLKDYFLTTQAEHSQLYCFHWMNLGTMSSGRCATLNISCRKTGKGSLSSVLEDEVDEKYYLNEKFLKKMLQYNKRQQENNRGFQFVPKEINSTADALQTGQGQQGGQAIRQLSKIRRLTPTECERLQGFPDDWTKGCSDAQRYKQMGNAVSIPVITAIGKRILRAMREETK